MRKALVTALLAGPLLALASPTNLLSNGSFESNVQANGSWSILGSLTGWSAGNLGVELRNNVAGSAQDGANFVELDTTGNSSISQSFATVLGQVYQLSFSYAQRPDQQGAASNGLSWSAGNSVNMLLAQDGNTAWTKVSHSFVATGASTTLTFAAIGNSDSYGSSLDSISVTSAVPEPQSHALLLAGLGAMILVARRRLPR